MIPTKRGDSHFSGSLKEGHAIYAELSSAVIPGSGHGGIRVAAVVAADFAAMTRLASGNDPHSALTVFGMSKGRWQVRSPRTLGRRKHFLDEQLNEGNKKTEEIQEHRTPPKPVMGVAASQVKRRPILHQSPLRMTDIASKRPFPTCNRCY